MTVAPARPVDAPSSPGCPTHRHPRPRSQPPPKLADGVQLLGEYAGSGYTTPQFLARLPGGQLVQLSELLHQVAEHCDGATPVQRIAERVSASYGKTVSARNVDTLVGKLRPLGVLAAADGSSPEVRSPDPLLGLKLRAQVLPPRLVRRLSAAVRPAFWPPLVAAVLVALAAVDVWLFFVHGVGAGVRATVEQPVVFLLVAAVVVVSAGLHEFGHAAACAYGGAKPGGMGAGIYVVWPAFYTDVTEAYRLDRRGRLRTDLGGVYVNAMVVVAVALAWWATRYEPLVLICFLLQIQVLQQMLPFLRLDGYYVVSDLVGVPDLFRRIGPVLRSAVPFRPLEPEVQALKPWVRRVIAGWVLVLVPVLGLNLGYFVLSAPRIAATAWDSAMRFLGQVPAGGLDGTIAAVQLLLLLLPAVGLTYTTLRLGRRAAASAWRWSDGSPARRLAATVGAAALLGVLTVAWFPDARLTPYREGERGTVQQSVRELSAFRSGAPLLRSPQQAQDRLPSIPSGRSAVLEAVPAPRGAPAADEPVATPTGPLTPTTTSAPPSPADDSPATEVGATPRPAPDGPTASPQAPSGAASPQTTTGPDGSVRATTSPTPTSTTSPAPDTAGPAPTPSGTTPTSPTDVTATPSSNG